MKKMFLTCLLALSLLPVVASAANVTITSDSFDGGGFIGSASASAENSVSNSHSGLTGSFDDFWTVELQPSAQTFSIVNTVPKFASFNVEYSLDGGATWTTYDLASTTELGETYTANVVNLSAFKLHIHGDSTNSFGMSGSYQMTVDSDIQAVPVPAAVWLFGSALMGLVGVTRRSSKKTAV